MNYTGDTIKFLKELGQHAEDSRWHERNRERYEEVLRGPTRDLLDQVRTRFVQKLNPKVAGVKEPLSRLKKNDFGKGGYYDHFWFAFYDPRLRSKKNSPQLFFWMDGRVWNYGFSTGGCKKELLERLRDFLRNNALSFAEYLRKSPENTFVSIDAEEDYLEAKKFAKRLDAPGDTSLDAFTHLELLREYPLSTLLNHRDGLPEEVGRFLVWAWPLFEASVTGRWQLEPTTSTERKVLEAVARIRAGSGGQGISISPAVRHAIEDHAMREATIYFTAAGYTVQDVHKTESYDLKCKRNAEVLYVEVKGTQTAGDEVLLTPGEVRLARDKSPNTALFVLHSVKVVEGKMKPRVTGGEIRIVRPWNPADSMLTPLGFSCVLPNR